MQEKFSYLPYPGNPGEQLNIQYSYDRIHTIDPPRSLSDQEVEEFVRSLPNFPNLHSLIIRDSIISLANAQLLAEFFPPNLQFLILDGNKLGDDGVKAIADALPRSLQLLTLTENNLGDESVKAIADKLSMLPSLNALELPSNNIADKGAIYLASKLIECPNLELINMDHNRCRFEGKKALLICVKFLPHADINMSLAKEEDILGEIRKEIKPDKSITVIIPKTLHITHESIGLLSSTDLQNIIQISSEGPLSSQNIKYLADHIKMCPNLKNLFLVDANISPKDAKLLALSLPQSLIILDLSDNNLGDKGVKAIANKLPMLPLLNVLELPFNDITDKGAIYLASKLIGCQNLVVINMDHNQLQFEGKKALLTSIHLLPDTTIKMHLVLEEHILYEMEAERAEDGSVTIIMPETLHITEESIGLLFATNPQNIVQICSVGHLSPQNVIFLAAYIKDCPSLNNLFLVGANISSEEAQLLARALPPSLIILDLSDNNLGDEGVTAIANRLGMLPKLEELYLAHVGMRDPGATYFAQKLVTCPSLIHLDVTCNEYTIEIGGNALIFACHPHPNIQTYYIDHPAPEEISGVRWDEDITEVPTYAGIDDGDEVEECGGHMDTSREMW